MRAARSGRQRDGAHEKGEDSMDSDALADIVRKFFAAFLSGDRAFAEETLAKRFTFSSPYDDEIDRAAYFERCWPNRGAIRAHRIETVIAAGSEAFVLYEVETTGGDRFRNTERFVFDGRKIASVQVFFGDPPSGVSKHQYQAFLSVAKEAWERRAR
jgi:ketosteroid isomerase-like protein